MERDDIPAIDVIEAAARKEREETEELLAGFDRPAREPGKAKKNALLAPYAGEAKAKAKEPAPAAQEPSPADESRKISTYVVPRTRELPAWMPWAALAALMILFGGLVAFLATGESQEAASKPAPSSVTTITSAPRPTATTRSDDVPPPAPPVVPTTTSDDAPPASAKPARSAPLRATPRPLGSAPASNGPGPREDFIRDL